MKYIKITLIAFIFTTILSTTLVNAIAIKGSTVVIDNDEHKVPGFYKLNARAIDSNNWLTSSLYGTWILG